MFLNLNFLGIKLKFSGLPASVAIPAFILFFIVMGALIPAILFWAIGVLFNFHIPYTFETVFATLVLLWLVKSGE